MLATDRDALICDLAETYHILDYKALPPSLVAVLASGLRENSRIKMKMGGAVIGQDRVLLAGIYDRLSFLMWLKTEDARNGINRPEPILDKLLGIEKKKEIVSFETPDDFNRRWSELTRS